MCGGSLGIYFILHDVSVIIVHNGIVNFNWGSVYLDAYNEQDYRQALNSPTLLLCKNLASMTMKYNVRIQNLCKESSVESHFTYPSSDISICNESGLQVVAHSIFRVKIGPDGVVTVFTIIELYMLLQNSYFCSKFSTTVFLEMK